MHTKITLLLLALVTPVLTGCIAGGAEEADTGLPVLTDGPFSVGTFVQDLEKETGASLVNAKVESLQVEYNQTRPTLVEWRSFTPNQGSCELVTTMVYEGQGRSGGFMVHHEDEPCPLTLGGQPTVAETVALVDRVSLTMIKEDVLHGAQVFSVALAGYCSYSATEDGTSVHVWNGAGVTDHTGEIRCGGGTGSALTLAVTVPQLSAGQNAPQTHIILEQVPAR